MIKGISVIRSAFAITEDRITVLSGVESVCKSLLNTTGRCSFLAGLSNLADCKLSKETKI